MRPILHSTIRRRMTTMMMSQCKLSSSSLSLPSSSSAMFQSFSFSPMRDMNISHFSSEATQEKKADSNSNSEPPKVEALRLLPTRHSRHHIPAVATVDVLDNATNKILNSIPGTLFGTLLLHCVMLRYVSFFTFEFFSEL